MNLRDATTRLGLGEPDTGEEPRTQVDGRASRLRSGSQSPQVGPGTTLTAPRRCPWCGYRCYGRVCRYCGDLERGHRIAERLPTMGDELRAAVSAEPKRIPWRATCPNPKCGEPAKPGRKYCASCRTKLYPGKTTLATLRGGGGSGRGADPT